MSDRRLFSRCTDNSTRIFQFEPAQKEEPFHFYADTVGIQLGAQSRRIEDPYARRPAEAIGVLADTGRPGIDAGNVTSSHLTGSRTFSPTVEQRLKVHVNRHITLIPLPDKIGGFRVYIKYRIRGTVIHSLIHRGFFS